MLLKLLIQFFIDGWGLLLIERKGVYYADVYIYLKLEQHFGFKCQLPLKTSGRYI